MPKKITPVPITGAVLKWAIREAGLTEEDFAERLKVPSACVYAWEAERARPGKTEFRKIVSILKRPSAAFFLAGPPETPSLESRFRIAPGASTTRLSQQETDGLRLAYRLQRAAAWVMEELGQDMPKFPRIAAGDDYERAGYETRASFDVPADVQVGWQDYGMAFRMWQQAIEAQGIPVFRLTLGPGNCRGFSLWDERVPLIAVNTSGYNIANRIYTSSMSTRISCCVLILFAPPTLVPRTPGDKRSSSGSRDSRLRSSYPVSIYSGFYMMAWVGTTALTSPRSRMSRKWLGAIR